MFKVFVTSILLLFSGITFGQEVLKVLDSLNYENLLPKGILQSKSLVLVKVPAKNNSPVIRGDWKPLAWELQPGFQKAGIDAVVYYYIDDIFSGNEVTPKFFENFEKRGLENIMFAIKENNEYQIIFTKITDSNKLVKAGQHAFKMTGNNLPQMMDNLYRMAANSPEENTNRLILEVPEFGEMVEAIKGRRGEYFDVNFSSEKLAVPAFADTAAIIRVMTDYPYKYEIIDPNLEDKELRQKGFQYVLYFVNTTAKNVKKILEYPTTETETNYISEIASNGDLKVKSISINTPVYKFYIKHIHSGNVFLGTKWDADINWHEALKNYVLNLHKELVR